MSTFRKGSIDIDLGDRLQTGDWLIDLINETAQPQEIVDDEQGAESC